MFDFFLTIFLVFLNGFFVAAEFAIVKVRASQIEAKVKARHRRAMLSKHIIEHLDGYLAATQLGITFASLGLGWIGEPVVSKAIINLFEWLHLDISPRLAHTIALPVAFVIITVLHIIFGELAPKSIAIQRSESTALLIAYPLQVFYIVFKPFIWVLNGFANFILSLIGISPVHGSEVHSSEELKYIVEQGKGSDRKGETAYDIISNAIDFSERTVKQIFMPRTQLVAIDIDDFNEAVLDQVIEEGFSRIPCYQDNLDNILGVVYLKDLLVKALRHQDIKISELMRPAFIVPESRKIGSLLKEFQKRHQQLAIVVNEFGGTRGIITMEDILEELVGEIQDEYDNEMPFVEKAGEGLYRVLGSASIENINEHLPHAIAPHEEYETLAGSLMVRFGRIPESGDRTVFDNYEFTILKMARNSIALVQLRDLGLSSP